MLRKGFFRRCIIQGLSQQCSNGEKCEITPLTRNSCQYCRLKKCFAVGMSRGGRQLFFSVLFWLLSCDDELMMRMMMIMMQCVLWIPRYWLHLCIALFKVLIFIVDKYANYDLHVPRLPMHWRRSSLSGFSDDWKLLRSCRLDFTALACCVEWHALWLCRACSCVYLVKEIMTVYSCKAKWLMLVIRDTVWPVYSLTNLNFCTPLPVKGN